MEQKEVAEARAALIQNVLASLEVKGYDPKPALDFANKLEPAKAMALAMLGFFLGRMTKKKIEVRPLLSLLKVEEKETLLQWIESNFSGGKTINVSENPQMPCPMNFGQLTGSCLIRMGKIMMEDDLVTQKTREGFNNSSALFFIAGRDNLWTYEASAYLPSSSKDFERCVAHMYWRMATTNGYLAPKVSTSLKIRSFVCEQLEIEQKATEKGIRDSYDELCKMSGAENPVPFPVLSAILEDATGKRNDDLNVSQGKNNSLRALATAAKDTIKLARNKAQKEK